jgi:hypothetical protein
MTVVDAAASALYVHRQNAFIGRHLIVEESPAAAAAEHRGRPARPAHFETRLMSGRFWAAIAAGAMAEDAAAGAGVSSPVGFRWFRQAGGVNLLLPETVSGSCLSSDERESIALWHAQGAGGGEIARRLHRRRPSRGSCGGTPPLAPIA